MRVSERMSLLLFLFMWHDVLCPKPVNSRHQGDKHSLIFFFKERQIARGHLEDFPAFMVNENLLCALTIKHIFSLTGIASSTIPEVPSCKLTFTVLAPETTIQISGNLSCVADGWQGHSVISRQNSIWGIGDWLVGLSGGQPRDRVGEGTLLQGGWLTDKGSAGSEQSWPWSQADVFALNFFLDFNLMIFLWQCYVSAWIWNVGVSPCIVSIPDPF